MTRRTASSISAVCRRRWRRVSGSPGWWRRRRSLQRSSWPSRPTDLCTGIFDQRIVHQALASGFVNGWRHGCAGTTRSNAWSWKRLCNKHWAVVSNGPSRAAASFSGPSSPAWTIASCLTEPSISCQFRHRQRLLRQRRRPSVRAIVVLGTHGGAYSGGGRTPAERARRRAGGPATYRRFTPYSPRKRVKIHRRSRDSVLT